MVLSVSWLILCFFFTSLLSPFLFTLFLSQTGCHHIFSQLPTTSYSATTDLNTDLALSVPLRQEREIPYPQLPPTMLQGRILPVSSVLQLLEYALLFLPDSYFQIVLLFNHSVTRLENIALGSKRW